MGLFQNRRLPMLEFVRLLLALVHRFAGEKTGVSLYNGGGNPLSIGMWNDSA
jgi:hypothetical protein